MAIASEPAAQLNTLHKPDGSATYSAYGYTILGAVNGPIEVMRRDELPEEAALEVNIRPAVGVGSTSFHANIVVFADQVGQCQRTNTLNQFSSPPFAASF